MTFTSAWQIQLNRPLSGPAELVRPKPDHFFSAWLGNGRSFYLSHGKDRKDRQIITRACLVQQGD